MTVTKLESPYSRVNKKQAADFFRVNHKTIDNWIRRGAPVVTRGGLGKPWELNLLELVQWYFANRHELRAVPPPEQMTPTDRRAWFTSEVLRHQLAERAGSLITAAELEETMQEVNRIVSDSLEAIPERLAQLGINAAAADAVRQEIEQSLQGFIENVADLVPEDQL